MEPQYGAFFSYEFTLSTENYAVRKVRPLTQIFDRPQFEVTFIAKKPKGNDLELYFTIKGDRRINLDARIATSELWPELKVRIGTSDVIIKASNFYVDLGEFKFVIKDFDKIGLSAVTVVGIQLRVKEQMLVIPGTNMTARLFLPNEIVISKGIEAPEAKKAPILKSVQLWDGQKWRSLKQNAEIMPGLHLRFVFDSAETLRELNIDQKYSLLNETYTSFMGKQIPGFGRISEIYHRSVRVEMNDMKQTRQGNQLYVEVNVDRNLAAEIRLGSPVMIDNSGVPAGGPLAGSGFVEHNALRVELNRAVTGISFVTQSGLSNDFTFKNPLGFAKIPGSELPGPDSMDYRSLQCMRLFN